MNLLRYGGVETAARHEEAEVDLTEALIGSAIQHYFESQEHPVKATILLGSAENTFFDLATHRSSPKESLKTSSPPRKHLVDSSGQEGDEWFWTADRSSAAEIDPVSSGVDCVFVPLTDGFRVWRLVQVEGRNLADLFRSAASGRLRSFFASLGPIFGELDELRTLRHRNAQLTLNLRQQIRRYRDLRWLTLIKSRRSATFLHDCRNSLGGMRSTTRGVLTGQVGLVKEIQQKSLESILEDLANLLSSMDRYEQVEELDRLRPQRVDLGRLCWQAIEAVSPLTARKAIELVPLIDDIPQIIGDRKQLRTMLSRVLRDAVESADPNTSLQFRLFQSNDEAFIRVDELDSGLAPKEEQISVAGIKKRSYSGHDSALAVVVLLHGGRVMTSRVPQSCKVLIAFPIIDSADCLSSEALL